MLKWLLVCRVNFTSIKSKQKRIHYHQHSKSFSDPTAWDDKERELESQVYYLNVWPLKQAPSPAGAHFSDTSSIKLRVPILPASHGTARKQETYIKMLCNSKYCKHESGLLAPLGELR